MAALLETRQLVKRFGGLVALNGIDFSVAASEIVSVIGPNGSGKTTLFNTISGVYQPDAGTVLMEGHDITGSLPNEVADRGIARTFQTIRLFNNLSVLDNVLIGSHRQLRTSVFDALVRPPRLRRREEEAHVRVRELLSIFGQRLLPRLDQPAYSLSYANRRRLEIARALASNPKLLLLDEPTAGMNPVETGEVVEQVHAIRARGPAIVVIEHKLNVVVSISDRVVVLDHGAKIAEGTAAAVRADPNVVEAYLGQEPASA